MSSGPLSAWQVGVLCGQDSRWQPIAAFAAASTGAWRLSYGTKTPPVTMDTPLDNATSGGGGLGGGLSSQRHRSGVAHLRKGSLATAVRSSSTGVTGGEATAGGGNARRGSMAPPTPGTRRRSSGIPLSGGLVSNGDNIISSSKFGAVKTRNSDVLGTAAVSFGPARAAELSSPFYYERVYGVGGRDGPALSAASLCGIALLHNQLATNADRFLAHLQSQLADAVASKGPQLDINPSWGAATTSHDTDVIPLRSRFGVGVAAGETDLVGASEALASRTQCITSTSVKQTIVQSLWNLLPKDACGTVTEAAHATAFFAPIFSVLCVDVADGSSSTGAAVVPSSFASFGGGAMSASLFDVQASSHHGDGGGSSGVAEVPPALREAAHKDWFHRTEGGTAMAINRDAFVASMVATLDGWCQTTHVSEFIELATVMGVLVQQAAEALARASVPVLDISAPLDDARSMRDGDDEHGIHCDFGFEQQQGHPHHHTGRQQQLQQQQYPRLHSPAARGGSSSSGGEDALMSSSSSFGRGGNGEESSGFWGAASASLTSLPGRQGRGMGRRSQEEDTGDNHEALLLSTTPPPDDVLPLPAATASTRLGVPLMMPLSADLADAASSECANPFSASRGGASSASGAAGSVSNVAVPAAIRRALGRRNIVPAVDEEDDCGGPHARLPLQAAAGSPPAPDDDRDPTNKDTLKTTDGVLTTTAQASRADRPSNTNAVGGTASSGSRQLKTSTNNGRFLTAAVAQDTGALACGSLSALVTSLVAGDIPRYDTDDGPTRRFDQTLPPQQPSPLPAATLSSTTTPVGAPLALPKCRSAGAASSSGLRLVEGGLSMARRLSDASSTTGNSPAVTPEAGSITPTMQPAPLPLPLPSWTSMPAGTFAPVGARPSSGSIGGQSPSCRPIASATIHTAATTTAVPHPAGRALPRDGLEALLASSATDCVAATLPMAQSPATRLGGGGGTVASLTGTAGGFDTPDDESAFVSILRRPQSSSSPFSTSARRLRSMRKASQMFVSAASERESLSGVSSPVLPRRRNHSLPTNDLLLGAPEMSLCLTESFTDDTFGSVGAATDHHHHSSHLHAPGPTRLALPKVASTLLSVMRTSSRLRISRNNSSSTLVPTMHSAPASNPPTTTTIHLGISAPTPLNASTSSALSSVSMLRSSGDGNSVNGGGGSFSHHTSTGGGGNGSGGGGAPAMMVRAQSSLRRVQSTVTRLSATRVEFPVSSLLCRVAAQLVAERQGGRVQMGRANKTASFRRPTSGGGGSGVGGSAGGISPRAISFCKGSPSQQQLGASGVSGMKRALSVRCSGHAPLPAHCMSRRKLLLPILRVVTTTTTTANPSPSSPVATAQSVSASVSIRACDAGVGGGDRLGSASSQRQRVVMLPLSSESASNTVPAAMVKVSAGATTSESSVSLLRTPPPTFLTGTAASPAHGDPTAPWTPHRQRATSAGPSAQQQQPLPPHTSSSGSPTILGPSAMGGLTGTKRGVTAGAPHAPRGSAPLPIPPDGSETVWLALPEGAGSPLPAIVPLLMSEAIGNDRRLSTILRGFASQSQGNRSPHKDSASPQSAPPVLTVAVFTAAACRQLTSQYLSSEGASTLAPTAQGDRRPKLGSAGGAADENAMCFATAYTVRTAGACRGVGGVGDVELASETIGEVRVTDVNTDALTASADFGEDITIPVRLVAIVNPAAFWIEHANVPKTQWHALGHQLARQHRGRKSLVVGGNEHEQHSRKDTGGESGGATTVRSRPSSGALRCSSPLLISIMEDSNGRNSGSGNHSMLVRAHAQRPHSPSFVGGGCDTTDRLLHSKSEEAPSSEPAPLSQAHIQAIGNELLFAAAEGSANLKDGSFCTPTGPTPPSIVHSPSSGEGISHRAPFLAGRALPDGLRVVGIPPSRNTHALQVAVERVAPNNTADLTTVPSSRAPHVAGMTANSGSCTAPHVLCLPTLHLFSQTTTAANAFAVGQTSAAAAAMREASAIADAIGSAEARTFRPPTAAEQLRRGGTGVASTAALLPDGRLADPDRHTRLSTYHDSSRNQALFVQHALLPRVLSNTHQELVRSATVSAVPVRASVIIIARVETAAIRTAHQAHQLREHSPCTLEVDRERAPSPAEESSRAGSVSPNRRRAGLGDGDDADDNDANLHHSTTENSAQGYDPRVAAVIARLVQRNRLVPSKLQRPVAPDTQLVLEGLEGPADAPLSHQMAVLPLPQPLPTQGKRHQPQREQQQEEEDDSQQTTVEACLVLPLPVLIGIAVGALTTTTVTTATPVGTGPAGIVQAPGAAGPSVHLSDSKTIVGSRDSRSTACGGTLVHNTNTPPLSLAPLRFRWLPRPVDAVDCRSNSLPTQQTSDGSSMVEPRSRSPQSQHLTPTQDPLPTTQRPRSPLMRLRDETVASLHAAAPLDIRPARLEDGAPPPNAKLRRLLRERCAIQSGTDARTTSSVSLWRRQEALRFREPDLDATLLPSVHNPRPDRPTHQYTNHPAPHSLSSDSTVSSKTTTTTHDKKTALPRVCAASLGHGQSSVTTRPCTTSSSRQVWSFDPRRGQQKGARTTAL